MGDDQLARLAARIERLEAAESARSHVYAYAHVLDEPRPETVTALFAPGATLTTGSGTARGAAEIRAYFTRAFAADPSRKRHFVVNPRTTQVGASRVRVRSAFLFTGRDAGSSRIGWGTYDDIIDVSGDQPLFVAKVISLAVGTDLASGWALGSPSS